MHHKKKVKQKLNENMNDIYLIGEIGWEVTLQSVIDSVKLSDKEKPLVVNIHSAGGSVYEGLAIYNYLKGLDQEVHTKSSGLVASISSIIFLAGKKESRTINATDNFLIHLPSGGAWGNAEDLQKMTEELLDIEEKLANIYALETSLTVDEAKQLMKKDEFLKTDFLKEKGFVNEIIEFKAVATYNKNKMNTNKDNALTKNDAESLFEKFFNKFFKKDEPKNKIVQDANGTEIDFTELADDETPSVGDTALVDGENASGDYVMTNGDTYSFTDGELMTITPSEEEEEETMESLRQENQSLKDELQDVANDLQNKEDEILNLSNKIDDMQNEFVELKNSITGKFEYNSKDKKDKKTTPSNSRSLFKTN